LPAIRPTAVAGSFYSPDAAELRSEIDDLLGSTVSAAIAPIPKALIAPHAGYIYSGPIAAAGYRRLAPARERIMRVVLFGPSHFVGFDGLAASSAEDWQTPLGTVPVDRPMVERLIKATATSRRKKKRVFENKLNRPLACTRNVPSAPSTLDRPVSSKRSAWSTRRTDRA
jgi:MEMO1 family protein